MADALTTALGAPQVLAALKYGLGLAATLDPGTGVSKPLGSEINAQHQPRREAPLAACCC